MYEDFVKVAPILQHHGEVGFHRGSVRRFMFDHERSVELAMQKGTAGIRELGPELMPASVRSADAPGGLG